MAHRVKCYYCGLTFDRDKEVDCVAVNQRRYAHLECHIRKQQEKTQEEKDLEALEEYIMQLLQVDYITPRVRKQINDFKAQYNYTYTGMRKALAYFYEVKKNSTEKANGGIGIIPYVYEEAALYYKQQEKQRIEIETAIEKQLEQDRIEIQYNPADYIGAKKKKKIIDIESIVGDNE